MDKPVEFDLSGALQRWRDHLSESPAFSGENLDELASHLRDSVARLQAAGLSDGEAFLISTKRIGTNRELGVEFGKVNGQAVLIDRLLWILMAFQIWRVLLSLTKVAQAASFRLISSANDLMPGFGFRGISGQSVELSAGLFGSALLLTAAGVSMWWFFFRPRDKLYSALERLLQRPVILSATLLFTMLLGSIVGGWSLLLWSFPLTVPPFVHLGYRDLVGNVIRNLPGFLIVALLTCFVARKRLRLNKA